MLTKFKLIKTIVEFFFKIWGKITSLKEKWETIDGYGGKYHISNNGRIYNSESDIIVKTYIKQDGYERVILYDRIGKNKEYRVHRLVATDFIPNLENKPYVNHLNGIRSDNRVENLAWATGSENRLAYLEAKKGVLADVSAEPKGNSC